MAFHPKDPRNRLGGPAWIAMLGAIVAVLAVVAMMAAGDRDAPTQPPPPGTAEKSPPGAPVEQVTPPSAPKTNPNQ